MVCAKSATKIRELENRIHNLEILFNQFRADIKIPGEYCADDECNCGAEGNHATMKYEDPEC